MAESVDPILGDKDFWMAVREAMLLILDALERKLAICPRTSEIRKAYKDSRRNPA